MDDYERRPNFRHVTDEAARTAFYAWALATMREVATETLYLVDARKVLERPHHWRRGPLG
jgi:hypothetical protein